MNASDWVALSSVLTVVVAAAAVIASLRGVRDQLRVTTFLTYTERYGQVMDGLPSMARSREAEYRLADVAADERAAVLNTFRDYFNMCTEEYWLHETGRIDRATWNVWLEGIESVLAWPCAQDAWTELASEYERFRGFIEERML